MREFVAIEIDGKLTIHADDPTGNYATLCGCDGDDPIVGQIVAVVPRGRKINCQHCYGIWLKSREYKASDFKI